MARDDAGPMHPSEIAEWVWILTGSGAAGFMTGETVTLSGGDVIR